MAHLQCNLIRRPRIPIPFSNWYLIMAPAARANAGWGLAQDCASRCVGSLPDGYVRLFLNYTVHSAEYHT